MSSIKFVGPATRKSAAAGSGLLFISTLLLVEFLDELLFGVREAAWPLVRDDLRLSYAEVGVVLGAPVVFGNLVEPALWMLADSWRRRAILLGGGAVLAASILLMGLSPGFAALLLATALCNPASGAFVGLSQAALMEAEPARREQNMARWALSGSLGNALGPAVLGAALWLGAGWRAVFYGLSLFAVVVLLAAWRAPFPTQTDGADEGLRGRLLENAREAVRALRQRRVLRWLVLLQLGDFTWDLLRGFLALYFVDVVGAGEKGAAVAVVVWTWAGLAGDALLLPLLERVRGIKYLRASTAAVVLLFPALLLVEGYTAKLVLLGLLGPANAGWYAILKARLYAELPGREGTALTLGNVAGLAGDLVPLALGAFAERYGLGAMMWLLAAGPPLLLLGLLTVEVGGEPEGGAGAVP